MSGGGSDAHSPSARDQENEVGDTSHQSDYVEDEPLIQDIKSEEKRSDPESVPFAEEQPLTDASSRTDSILPRHAFNRTSDDYHVERPENPNVRLAEGCGRFEPTTFDTIESFAPSQTQAWVQHVEEEGASKLPVIHPPLEHLETYLKLDDPFDGEEGIKAAEEEGGRERLRNNLLKEENRAHEQIINTEKQRLKQMDDEHKQLRAERDLFLAEHGSTQARRHGVENPTRDPKNDNHKLEQAAEPAPQPPARKHTKYGKSINENNYPSEVEALNRLCQDLYKPPHKPFIEVEPSKCNPYEYRAYLYNRAELDNGSYKVLNQSGPRYMRRSALESLVHTLEKLEQNYNNDLLEKTYGCPFSVNCEGCHSFTHIIVTQGQDNQKKFQPEIKPCKKPGFGKDPQIPLDYSRSADDDLKARALLIEDLKYRLEINQKICTGRGFPEGDVERKLLCSPGGLLEWLVPLSDWEEKHNRYIRINRRISTSEEYKSVKEAAWKLLRLRYAGSWRLQFTFFEYLGKKEYKNTGFSTRIEAIPISTKNPSFIKQSRICRTLRKSLQELRQDLQDLQDLEREWHSIVKRSDSSEANDDLSSSEEADSEVSESYEMEPPGSPQQKTDTEADVSDTENQQDRG
ncbi:hypothetical protein CC80DRAFT_550053 [Byssothecium circinans]|uniref:Uncharacterized protein n=1 Tax=Byssothecium circinans TaxID=147558 RepID=A0A6A5TT87_9PLEO|nr:hypothetical protein CC80DRAFT_550053 [Byssothecium circinans]